MKTKKKIVLGDIMATYEHSEALTDAIMEKVLAFVVQHQTLTGDSVVQSDDPNLASPCLVAEIVDLFNFCVEYE
jgi:hypothetical protein